MGAVFVAQISDLHLDGSARATDRATRVLAHLRGLRRPPDALLVTGDIADHGADAEYAEARRLLDLPFPVLTCPGNHDVREPYRRVLLGGDGGDGDDGDGPSHSVHQVADGAVLMCDSTVPGANGGRLGPADRGWIADTLAALDPGTPVLLVMHHPPASAQHPELDTMLLADPGGLADLITAHPAVAGLLTGHAHTAAATTFAGRPLVIAPGVASTVRMPWEGTDPLDLDAPPGFAYHVVTGGRLATHFRTVR